MTLEWANSVYNLMKNPATNSMLKLVKFACWEGSIRTKRPVPLSIRDCCQGVVPNHRPACDELGDAHRAGVCSVSERNFCLDYRFMPSKCNSPFEYLTSDIVISVSFYGNKVKSQKHGAQIIRIWTSGEVPGHHMIG